MQDFGWQSLPINEGCLGAQQLSSPTTDLALSRVSLHEVVGLELFLLVGHDARHLEHEPRLRRVLFMCRGHWPTFGVCLAAESCWRP